jgi:hypothetical protein
MPTALESILDWARKQQVSTLLLIGILWGIWDATPRLVEQVKLGYQENARVLADVTKSTEAAAFSQRAQEELMHDQFRQFMQETRMLHKEQLDLLKEILGRLPQSPPTP